MNESVKNRIRIKMSWMKYVTRVEPPIFLDRGAAMLCQVFWVLRS